ncbi:MAG: signal recognition particle protein [Myxococcota bacterium]
MLETLTNGFRSARHKLQGMSEINEKNIKSALREVKMSLLEADVDFKVTKNFIKNVKEQLKGEVVKVKAQGDKNIKVKPGEHFIKACYDELVNLMGPVDLSLEIPEKGIASFMMVGLQGSGKTTTTAKLAKYLQKNHKRKPLLVAADVYRPAAIDQLKVLGKQTGFEVYSEDVKDPPGICERAVKYAKLNGLDTLIFDTAGRLAIDEVLMEELIQIKKRTQPDNIFLVIDAMIGQDAVKTASTFDDKLDISGSILTKLDGDARGGSALSIKKVTGKPIKFLGMGESLDNLEEFRPEGMASRILGMGDIVGLVQDFEDVVDAEQAEKDAEKMLKGKFNMSDFLEQIKTIQKMGSLKDLMEKMPFFPDGLPDEMNLDDSELVRIEAIINSMTKTEKDDPETLIKNSREVQRNARRKHKKNIKLKFYSDRTKRIAKGSGTKTKDVEELIARFITMRQVMAQLGQNQGLLSKIPGFKQLNQMKKMKNMDVNDLMSFGQMGDTPPDLDPGLAGTPGLPGAPGPTPTKVKLSKKKRKKRKKRRKMAKKSRRKKRRKKKGK